MPSETKSPALFPDHVAQHSVLFDPSEPGDLADWFPGVALPDALARAVRKRQAEFLAGRFCAREALARCAPEHANAPIPIGPQREPLWPPGIVGAITHAHGFASVAVARAGLARGVGLDAERIMRDEQAEEVAGHIAAPNELAAIARATGWSNAVALTAIFSAKETVFKCLSPQVGRYFDFRDAWVDAFERGHFTVRLLTTLTPSLREGHALEGRYELGEGTIVTAMVLAP
jgi:enterobactin synthetase component D